MTPPKPDAATGLNAGLLEQLSARNISRLPWFGESFSAAAALEKSRVRETLAAIAAGSSMGVNGLNFNGQ
jgi:hypothetical protein